MPAHDVFGLRKPLRHHPVRRARCGAVSMTADGQHIMVNACTGKMGHATAEAVVRAGLSLVPYSFTGSSEAVAVGNVGVEGIPVELVGPEERQQAMEQAKREYPNMIIIDFTLPQAVNGMLDSKASVRCSQGINTTCTRLPSILQITQSSTVKTRSLLSWGQLEGTDISLLRTQSMLVSTLLLLHRWESRCERLHSRYTEKQCCLIIH